MARAVYQTHPSFFRTSNPTDRRKFNALLKKQPSIEILDTIEEQLMEYIKCCSPKEKYTERVLRQKARAIFKETPKQDYGVWVHYPWLNKIVHLLDEREFVTVRTNRNQYKITPEERDLLSSKSIGVIGLSVGQSIALTIAMERICGEIRLADFDVVELSNLNRIRTGVHHLGLKKTVIVAREIAEIDPYLKVNCLHEGITENNIDAFFTEGGKLDLCLEECDGLFVKILTRQRAKIHRVPIVMNSSDRGTTDIERYDKSPEMPILHGLIDHLDVNKVKEAKTNEEKVPYLLPMLGVETSTARLKSSMLEIEQTINTWPQLASGVVLGGGITADVSRRVLLGELKKSGRYFVDLDELINDKLAGKNNVSKHPAAEELPHTAFSAFEKATAKLFKSKTYAQFSKPVKAKKLGKKTVKKLVDAACTAPSGGNVQPWKWVYQNKTLLLFHDRKRSASVLNYNNNAAYIGLGAATQNVILAAESMGYKANLLSFPLGQKNDLTAAFLFSETKDSKPEAEALASFIHKRGTNRLLTKRAPLRTVDKAGITSAVESIDNAQLHLVTSNQQLNAVKSILSSVDQLFLMNKKGHHHFMNEMRWTKAEAEATKEGVDIDTIDITPTERAGLEVSRNWEVTRNLKKWKLGSAYGKLTQKGVDAAAAIGIISMPKENAASFFEGGMALQNAWLAATKANLAFQPMSISTFLFELAASNDKANSDIKDIKKGLLALKQDFFSLFNLDNRIPVFIFRLGKTDHRTPVKSMRKDLKEVWRYADH